MREFDKPDETVIDRIIKYSIILRNIRLSLLQLRRTKLMINRIWSTIPSQNYLNDIEAELLMAEGQIQNACRILLLPLLEGKDFGHRSFNHWAVSMNEIRDGYCEFEEILGYSETKPMFGRRYILLLRDYEDSTLGKFYGGELIPYSVATHFLSNIPKKEDKIKGLFDAVIYDIEMAMRYRNKHGKS